jgi:hypothetical protein
MALLTTKVPPAKSRGRGSGTRRPKAAELTPYENGKMKALDALKTSIEDFDRGYEKSRCFRPKAPGSRIYYVTVKIGNAALPYDGKNTKYFVQSRDHVRQVLVDYYQQIKAATEDSDLGKAIADVARRGSRSGFRVSALGAIYNEFAKAHNTTRDIAKAYFKNNPEELERALADRGL